MTTIVGEPPETLQTSEDITVQGQVPLPEETLSYFGHDELRARVFYEKYAMKNEAGVIVEKIPPEMWRRVAHEIASVEATEQLRKEWEERFYWLLEEFRFIPGGRILFGAGQSRRATLLNCYYFGVGGDSLESIFDFCREAARTYSYGGGVGTDISLLRPRGAPVQNSAIVSTGSVSFMELFSVTTGTIGQAGRRGALMITIRVDHPDIFDFINVKRDLQKVTHANISVKVTDAFMEAVLKDAEFELWFENEKVSFRRMVRARDVWERLVKSARDTAEPGVIFWDNVKQESPTEYSGMEVNGVNPCSEQCLEEYGNCCLGNINLSAFVLDEFTPVARLDWDQLERAVRYTVRFLDNVLDYNADRHPLQQQKKASLWSRRIGVGFTGLADMLIKLGYKYDEEETVRYVEELFKRLKNIAYDESGELASEKAVFPAFDLQKHLERPFIQRLSKQVVERIQKHGLRNACILTIPPVGSGSILAGTTSGIEPVFALSYVRRSKSLSEGEFKVYHPLAQEYMKRFGLKDEGELPPFFVTAHMIKPELRVKMQASIQKHVDSSISSTVNLREDISVEEVEKIYFLAWKLGCKGITVYREGSREGILETDQARVRRVEQPFLYIRPRVLTGRTLRFKLPEGKLYVTLNRDEKGVKEVFVNLGKSGEDEKAYAEALGRLISLYLQQGGDVKEVIHTLKGIQGKHVVWSEGVQLLSVPDAVAKALEMGIGEEVVEDHRLPKCPECSEESIIYENGCYRCTACGYTKCG